LADEKLLYDKAVSKEKAAKAAYDKSVADAKAAHTTATKALEAATKDLGTADAAVT